MRHSLSIASSALLLLVLMTPLSPAGAQGQNSCSGLTGPAYGLCTVYCVHLGCGTDANAPQNTCQRLARTYQQVVGTRPVCTSSSGPPSLSCSCSQGILSCVARDLQPGALAFLNIDLSSNGGFNGVADTVVDSSGQATFAPFDVATYLSDRSLDLSSVLMALTNQPGQVLAETEVNVCMSSTAPPALSCSCSLGVLSCVAWNLNPGAFAYLNIDLSSNGYGFNGVADTVVDASGHATFLPFNVATYLSDRALALASVVMAVTNQPGQILVERTVPVCASSTAPASLSCSCSQGILSCVARNLQPGVFAFLNIDLSSSGGFNGVADTVVDTSGQATFAPFDVATYLSDRSLDLSSVLMALTNQPGQVLAETEVNVCH